jgi:hypothetical protein
VPRSLAVWFDRRIRPRTPTPDRGVGRLSTTPERKRRRRYGRTAERVVHLADYDLELAGVHPRDIAC